VDAVLTWNRSPLQVAATSGHPGVRRGALAVGASPGPFTQRGSWLPIGANCSTCTIETTTSMGFPVVWGRETLTTCRRAPCWSRAMIPTPVSRYHCHPSSTIPGRPQSRHACPLTSLPTPAPSRRSSVDTVLPPHTTCGGAWAVALGLADLSEAAGSRQCRQGALDGAQQWRAAVAGGGRRPGPRGACSAARRSRPRRRRWAAPALRQALAALEAARGAPADVSRKPHEDTHNNASARRGVTRAPGRRGGGSTWRCCRRRRTGGIRT